jgi:type I restriction enzyme M protein
LFGQEANLGILALAKMNMYIHDIPDVHLEFGDTFLYPKFKEADGLRRFDVVVANPPWNQDGYDESVLKKGEFWKQRFSYGLAPRQSADWAWVQHMLASAKDDGSRVGIVIDSGCLFRGGKEKAVRSAVLSEENDLVESVILLPEKLFYNTGAPGAIVIFNKHKPAERSSKVLFVNASKEFEQHPEVRKLNILGKNHIEKIACAHRSFGEEQGFARVVGLDEIKRNDYNLNVTLYVMADEEGEQIDITKEYEELKELEKERSEVSKKLERYVAEIAQANGE